ncbi:MAG: V-type ATP synthase subunit F [Syntrophales bacterium]|nr:V-type ATP synthase subunit F [Syntrophales bacterium]
MSKIYLIGDIHTVSAFRLAGITGVVSDGETVASTFESIVEGGDASILAITNELARGLEDRINKMAMTGALPVVIEIPGIDDEEGFSASALNYITEALGIAL